MINYVHSTSYAVRSYSGVADPRISQAGRAWPMVEDRSGTPALAARARAITARRTGRMPAARPADGAPRRRGPRPRHTRQDVALAAVAIADADGIDKVTFRAVAARLGVGVMSLYNYVPDKQALVYDMAADSPPPNSVSPSRPATGGPTCTGSRGEQRALLHRHPWLVTESSHLQPPAPTRAPIELALGRPGAHWPSGTGPAGDVRPVQPVRRRTGARPSWPRARPPPDSERAGRASG